MNRQCTRKANDKKNLYNIGIYVSDPGFEQQAATLSTQTGLPVVSDKTACEIALAVGPDGLSLSLPNDPSLTGNVQVNFTKGAWTRRLKRVRSERLIKAMGSKTPLGTEILDATGGLGRDSFLLAAAGFQVQVVERNPILAALLVDGLHRAVDREETKAICSRIQCIQEDALDYLTRDGSAPEIIYLDPMFPKTKSRAKVKKELQIIQQVVGEDHDIADLFTLALQAASKRVVVKRPKSGPWLNQLPPAYSLLGKAVRFDIYLPLPASGKTATQLNRLS